MIKIQFIHLIGLFLINFLFTNQVLSAEEIHTESVSAQDQTPVAIYKTEESIYLIAGNSYSPTKGSGSWLWKIDSDGNKIKEENLDLFKGRLQNVIILGKNEIVLMKESAGIKFKTNDGNFLCAISTNNKNDSINPQNYIQLIKKDKRDKILWDVKHGGFSKDSDIYFYNGINTKKGEYLFLLTEGKYNKFGAGPSSVWLLKCDASGNIVAKIKNPDGRINFRSNNYLALNGNNIIFSYSTSELPSCDKVPAKISFGAKIVCLDYNMKKLWEKTLSGYQSMIPPLVTSTSDGNFLVVGVVDKGPQIIKLSPAGDVLWEKVYQKIATDNLSYNVIGLVAHDNICMIVGSVSDFMKSNIERVFLLKIDTKTSNAIWQKQF